MYRVLIPSLMPGILSGALWAFTLCLNGFVINLFVSGAGSSTLPVFIFSQVKKDGLSLIHALGFLISLATFAVVFLTQIINKQTHESNS